MFCIKLKFYIFFNITISSQKSEFFYRFFIVSYLINTVLNDVGVHDGKHSVFKQEQLYLTTMKWGSVNYFNIPKNVLSFTVLLSCFWQNDTFKETLVIILIAHMMPEYFQFVLEPDRCELLFVSTFSTEIVPQKFLADAGVDPQQTPIKWSLLQ